MEQAVVDRKGNLWQYLSILAVLLIAIVFLLCGCGENEQKRDGNVSNIHWSDLTKTGSMELSYATQFSVDYFDGDYALITVAGEQRYLLLPDGGTVPQGLPDDITILHRKPKEVYIASSSCMDFWRAVDELDAVRFTSTKRQDWDLPEVAERMTDGDLEFVGKYNAPDFEYLLAEGCDFAVENTMVYHTPETLEKLEALGIPVLVEYSSYEESPLGRLEWIRLWGLLTGREKEADGFFDGQAGRVSRLTEGVIGSAKTSTDDNEGVVTEVATTALVRVAYFSVNVNGVIRVPKPSSYIPKLIEMAGGEYVVSDDDVTDDSRNAASSMNMQMEDFYAAARDADVLIYNGTIEGGLSAVDELVAKNALFGEFEAVKGGRVWCQSGDLFQHPTAVADEVAEFWGVIAGQDGKDNGMGKFLRKVE